MRAATDGECLPRRCPENESVLEHQPGSILQRGKLMTKYYKKMELRLTGRVGWRPGVATCIGELLSLVDLGQNWSSG